MRTDSVRHTSLSYGLCTHVVRYAQTTALVCTPPASRRTTGPIRYCRRRWQWAGIAPLPPTRPKPAWRLCQLSVVGDVRTNTYRHRTVDVRHFVRTHADVRHLGIFVVRGHVQRGVRQKCVRHAYNVRTYRVRHVVRMHNCRTRIIYVVRNTYVCRTSTRSIPPI